MSERMKEIVALCKRRGFIFPASEIYGGINGFWDYGPLGTELKNNVRDLWWQAMVKCPPIGPDGQPLSIFGLDSAIIQNPKVWEASGHVGGFNDPMVDCRESKKRYRADHLIVLVPNDGQGPWPAFDKETESADIDARLKKIARGRPQSDYRVERLDKLTATDFVNVFGPDAKEKGTLTEPRQFNMMFETYVGAVFNAENKTYLRPETAQGIFLNFKNVVDSLRARVPFGIAQIGKMFRNEVTPRNFIFRSREFEAMEIEFFCHPSEAKMWQQFWFEERVKFWTSLGISRENMQLRNHDQDELAHYAKEGYGTADIEYKYPFTAPDFGELEGIAHRCDFDLKAHQEHSGIKLEYLDQVTNERFTPHVIEPAAGLTRGVLALICEAYTVDESRPSGMYLNFKPAVAPIKAAILPLTAKDEHPKIATDLYLKLRNDYMIDLDIKQNIGKRYARQDEIGTPYCFTIDDQTVADQTVTVRERNTMKQERIALDQVDAYLAKNLKAF